MRQRPSAGASAPCPRMEGLPEHENGEFAANSSHHQQSRVSPGSGQMVGAYYLSLSAIELAALQQCRRMRSDSSMYVTAADCVICDEDRGSNASL